MSIFYHVSTDLHHLGIFEPRIPSCRHRFEDNSIPRISVSPTIADCFTSLPNSGTHLDELNASRSGLYAVFRIDTDFLGIDSKNIITSEELYEKDLVRDADETSEHWITSPFIVPNECKYLIKVISWREDPIDILPHSIFKIADEEYGGDYLQAYQDVHKELVPCSIGITELVYLHPKAVKGQEITFEVKDTLHKMMLIEYLTEHYKVTITVNEDENHSLKFKMNESEDLTSLFLYEEHLLLSN